MELLGFLNELVLESDGNVGAFDPIGSKELKWCTWAMDSTFKIYHKVPERGWVGCLAKESNLKGNMYLVIGTGNAWAWQNSARLALLCFTKVKVFESKLNVGAFEPIGSAVRKGSNDYLTLF